MKIPQNVCAIDSVANNSSFAASGQSTNFSWFDQHQKSSTTNTHTVSRQTFLNLRARHKSLKKEAKEAENEKQLLLQQLLPV